MKDRRAWEKDISQLMQKIGYTFTDRSILLEALTHSSYANEWKQKKMPNNERLEFLGDSVLSLIISQYIFCRYADLPEGELTKVRANVVCEASLAFRARNKQIGRYLLLGKGEESSGGRNRDSILADAMEALIAAIYIDGGYDEAKCFVLDNFKDLIKQVVSGNYVKDFKTYLQELIQSNGHEPIVYEVIKEDGPDHNKIFYVEVRTGEKVIGRGSGKNKKEAEQSAAREAIEILS